MKTFDVGDAVQLERSGPNDLLRLRPLPGRQPVFFPKHLLQTVAWCVARRRHIHLSGPTGAGKTGLLENLLLVPENLEAVCRSVGLEPRPVQVHAIEMSQFGAAPDIWCSVELTRSRTRIVPSPIVRAIMDTQGLRDSHFVVVWLRELGRVMTASIQGSLVSLVQDDIELYDGQRLDASHVVFVTDSNHFDDESLYTLVQKDAALMRRWLTMPIGYLAEEQEATIVSQLLGDSVPDDQVAKVVRIGAEIRAKHKGGGFKSVSPPTIRSYVVCLEAVRDLQAQVPVHELVRTVLLGGVGPEDAADATAIVARAFGLRVSDDRSRETRGATI